MTIYIHIMCKQRSCVQTVTQVEQIYIDRYVALVLPKNVVFFRWTNDAEAKNGMLEDSIQNSAVKISEMPTHINM